MARLVLMALVCILGGCAFAEDTVAIKYNPPANLVAIPNAQAVQVAVQGQDGRVSNKDRVGSKKNGYGMETARITAKDDIVKLMQYAVSHEMTSFGFVEGPNGLKVNVEVSTFYNDFKMGVFSGDAVSEVAFNLTIAYPDGALAYAHVYKGVGMNHNILFATGSQALPALQEALTNAMQSMINDPTLQTMLQKAAEHTVHDTTGSRSSPAS